ncbi:hypothetical protein FOCC_FOCC011867 [Frankliniella occidentalis]|uniref:Zinc finger protein 26-like n=1 Tax=Frankliniella occidentalis TaxID=133901 RepID=A0A9C6X1G0_FRAOC|nr:zinc finger protein 26-like [Frankliniella occidentalis]KAE8742573.1 hypothetical protein FOCC_FOCC011867 [Frankliniella occidentalis]
MTEEEYIDVAVVCRICLTQRGNVDIFEHHEEQDTDGLLVGYSVAERIMSFACIEVLIDDGLPNQICNGCLSQIDLACRLKVQCEYADATLRQICSEENVGNNTICFLTHGDNNGEVSRAVVKHTEDDLSTVIVGSECEVPIIVSMDSDQEGQTEIEHFSNLMENQSANKENEISLTSHQNKLVKSSNCFSEEVEDHPDEHSDMKGKTFKMQSTCPDCGEYFPSRNQLAAHALSKPGHKPFVCGHCDKAFVRPSSLREHEKRHSGSQAFLCNNCGQFAPYKKLHYCTVVNDKTNKKYSCDVCDKKFVSHVTLFTHKKRHETQSKYQCSECHKLYFSRQELERHVRVHSNVRPFQCPENGCALTFFSQGELNRHTRYHKGIKRFSCDVCGKKFFESGHLSSHVRKHTGERPYICKHCPRKFLDSSKLQRHMKAHMKPPSKRSKTWATKENDETVNLIGYEVSLEDMRIKNEHCV